MGGDLQEGRGAAVSVNNHTAWGYVEYKEPLTDKQIKDYELTE